MPEVAPVRSLKRLLRSPSGLASVVSCTAGTWTLESGAATGVTAMRLVTPAMAIPVVTYGRACWMIRSVFLLWCADEPRLDAS